MLTSGVSFAAVEMGGGETFDQLTARLERLFGELDALEEDTRARVYELLDAVDTLHRTALARLGELLGPVEVERLASADPAVAWLVDAYSVGLDERAAAEAALAPVRPYIHSHGGEVEVLEAAGGVVRVRLSGACSGCTASSVTLTRGIEEALRENLPGFLALDAEQDTAPAHPPPGPTLLQIENRLGIPTP
jgi:Fe-S cluster biogenesis protein NfuA